jgi:predicted ATPase
LAGARLLTLTGPGGSGKTRLAAQLAAEQTDLWHDGVWWVELGAISDPGLVAELVASAVGVLVEPVQGALRSLSLQLRDRRALVCLDNCEHVLDGAAEVADALMRTCAGVSVLTTSREPLGVAGEVIWTVPTLIEHEAVSLFCERGRQVRPDFGLDPANAPVVRAMCARLDGLPLALELAAAWLRTLTPRQIEAGLDDRFALLVRGPRGVVARHETLAASIAWSHDLLDEADRVVLRRLSVFAGGFVLEAARSVCGEGAVLGALARLVDKSLVLVEERDGQARYRLLETIRQYAKSRLDEAGEAPRTRERHLDHYLAFVERSEGELDCDKDRWRARLELEHDNLRAALEWGLAAEDPERGRRAPDDRSRLQARLLAGVAVVADTAGPLDLEFDVAQQALELATEHGDQRLRCLCLELAAVGQFYTDFDAAWELNLEAGQLAVAMGDGMILDGSRALQAMILLTWDRHDEAQPLFDASIEALLARGDRAGAPDPTGAACGTRSGLPRRPPTPSC